MKKKRGPARQRCPRCGVLGPPFAGTYCFDCAHQVELPLPPRTTDPVEDLDDRYGRGAPAVPERR
jgi:hypothetical protein